MVILGLGDGLDAGAALAIDNELVAVELQERHDRVPRSRAFPWSAIEEVLEESGIRARHVEEVGIAGQFSPPFFLRRHPGLRRLARDPFSPAVDASVFFQSVLRHTGIGALEADRAAEWMEKLLRGHGFAPERVILVDVHKALAEAAYRTQPREDATVFTLHPMGDGVSFAVHYATDGQLDRAWAQKGFSSLHVHLQRCAAALGFDANLDMDRVWAVAAAGAADPDLVHQLSDELHVVGARLSRRGPRGSAVYRALSTVERPTAAASVLAHLVEVVKTLIGHHLVEAETGHVVLGGAVFDNPRLCAAVADLPEVESVWVHPTPGYASLPLGAAASLGGLAPRLLPRPGLGRQYSERQFARALGVAGLPVNKPADEVGLAVDYLSGGQAIARFQARAGHSRFGSATRSVLVRADDRAGVEHLRNALGRAPEEEPACVWLETARDRAIRNLDKFADAAGFGAVALEVDDLFAARYPGVITADGRVLLQRVDPDADPGLARILAELHRRTGCAALACFPLAEGRDPPVAVPGDAIRVWRRSGISALLLGPFVAAAARPALSKR